MCKIKLICRQSQRKVVYSQKKMQAMRNIVFIMFASVLLLSCATGQTASEKKAAARQLQSQIEDSINQRTIKVTVNFANPLRMPPRHLTTDYSIALRGDTVTSWLPYFGVAHRADISNDTTSPLIFKEKAYDVKVVKGKRDAYDITFATRHHSESLEYRLSVFPNGNAMVNVTSSDRDVISFDGDVDVDVDAGAHLK